MALFDVKGSPQAWALRLQMDSSLSRTLSMHKVRYYIVTDGEEFWVIGHGDKEFILTSFESIVQTVREGLPVLGETPSSEVLFDAISEVAKRAKLKQTAAISFFLRKARTKPLFKMDSSTGYIEFSNNSAEDAFFSHLLNGQIPHKLCRFTTRHNLFQLLEGGKQNLCSIVCMNEKSEENYSDTKVGLNCGDPRELNNYFILSLMPQEKSDDLTMWRLYGDDAKGVCLNYEVEKERRGRKLNGDFYISAISYGVDESSHPELDFLKLVLSLNISHWHFHFNRWHIWKHFFKSFRFKDEKEIRLLYLSDGKKSEEKKWIENSDSGIVSKMLLFSMIPNNNFPLRLTNVIVGPKSPEPTKIAEQFAFLVSQEWDTKYTSIIIRESSIKEYR